MAFEYKPFSFSMPKLQNIGQNNTSSVPTTNIANNYAKSFLDTLGKNIKPITGFTSKSSFDDALAPAKELGQQFIQQALLPEFQQQTYNPYRQAAANRAAGSNISLMGNAGNYQQAQERAVTQPFYDQANSVTDLFNSSAYGDLNDLLKDYYNTQINF